jgi:hypothetical protein
LKSSKNFPRDETLDWHSNIYTGLIGVTVFFMMVSVLTLPNGPFTRPHPAIWRCVLGKLIKGQHFGLQALLLIRIQSGPWIRIQIQEGKIVPQK